MTHSDPDRTTPAERNAPARGPLPYVAMWLVAVTLSVLGPIAASATGDDPLDVRNRSGMILAPVVAIGLAVADVTGFLWEREARRSR